MNKENTASQLKDTLKAANKCYNLMNENMDFAEKLIKELLNPDWISTTEYTMNDYACISFSIRFENEEGFDKAVEVLEEHEIDYHLLRPDLYCVMLL
jgi:hypothetical protein